MRDEHLGLTYKQFVNRLRKSQNSVEFVAEYIKSKGYKVEVPELRITPDEASRADYSDEIDLIFYRQDGKKVLVEIKQLSVQFTTEKYPFKEVLVNSITGYDSKKVKPDIHLLLSKDKEYAIVIKNETFDKWVLKEIFDKVKQRKLLFYFVDKKHTEFIKLA